MHACRSTLEDPTAVSRASDVDIAIVGAGAAGIAAARRAAAAGARVVVLEAADRVGGRCFTDTRTFGVPYDRGAHAIHDPDNNPVARLAAAARLDVYPAPAGQRIRIGRRNARESEVEDFLAASVRANRAIADVARSGKVDIAAAQALPPDLADWRRTVEFMLGPYTAGHDLSEVSCVDFARANERDTNGFCRQGLGGALAKLAETLPVKLSTPVSRVELTSRSGVDLNTPSGYVHARAAIVTVSTGVLSTDAIRFDPELPKRVTDAIAKLKPGSYERIALELPGNPLGLQSDEMVLEKSDGPRTAVMLANVAGSALHFVDIGGSAGRQLAAQGEPAMLAFATDWLTNLFGDDVKKSIKRSQVTRWGANPLIGGSWSCAAPGAQPGRKVLMESQRDRLWFAGEAVHETEWGTVEGAWDSGERAATEALRRLGLLKQPPSADDTPRRSSGRSYRIHVPR